MRHSGGKESAAQPISYDHDEKPLEDNNNNRHDQNLTNWKKVKNTIHNNLNFVELAKGER